jgi:hypothetical protein
LSKRVALIEANEKLTALRRNEETKCTQRAEVKHIQGGNNTQYFHFVANGKHRKKRVFQLEQEERTIVGEDNFKLCITEYYKKMFEDPSNLNFT